MFKDRVAVITGSQRGIGRAIAESLAEKGCNIVISDINAEGAQKTADEIAAQFGVKAIGVGCNVTKKEEQTALANAAVEKLGRLDIWVNNAGAIRDDLLMRMSEADWDLVQTVNLKGVFFGIQAATKVMMKAKYGKIVNISSVAGLVGSAGQANYASAKAGVIAITKTAAREYASRNITVNAVCPGFILTDMTSNLPDKWKEEVIKQTPLPKRGEPADIAKAVRFLASSDADFITGVILRVDGGMVIGL
ncbi:MAG TPA: 3-oxoacyl-[acyl-carrier-protein] reductase [Turneriella sp.]|nr:3-oxoacyl-[acyl-carrier-protein] reductase [Turneriella sp.]HMY10049.1 3-oxoacyl-[acyl-carrier-protein] reductase [Turneriella sp.]HNA79798.1 3-oxoacyl-[acyl-carrier-protein] reductase [Turneriella sp.]HNE18939.1 3-oxoacyl-[acyl-carrier-protein] reductase [Turneriella sp.]HNL09107.1 3-oxoacyl-[acyl-carrier-protein] reductase [Turneriella sp.]